MGIKINEPYEKIIYLIIQNKKWNIDEKSIKNIYKTLESKLGNKKHAVNPGSKKIRKKRKQIIPSQEKRCQANSKNGQCKVSRRKDSNFCGHHNNMEKRKYGIYDPFTKNKIFVNKNKIKIRMSGDLTISKNIQSTKTNQENDTENSSFDIFEESESESDEYEYEYSNDDNEKIFSYMFNEIWQFEPKTKTWNKIDIDEI